MLRSSATKRYLSENCEVVATDNCHLYVFKEVPPIAPAPMKLGNGEILDINDKFEFIGSIAETDLFKNFETEDGSHIIYKGQINHPLFEDEKAILFQHSAINNNNTFVGGTLLRHSTLRMSYFNAFSEIRLVDTTHIKRKG